MYISDSGNVARRIVLAIIEELDARNPGFAGAVESRLNSATKGDFPFEADFREAQRAAEIVRELTAELPS